MTSCPHATGAPRAHTPVQVSSFRLSYYTLLNLLRRTEGGLHNMEHVITHSFQQFQQERAMPKVGRGWGVGGPGGAVGWLGPGAC